jgi:hypothetical protein
LKKNYTKLFDDMVRTRTDKKSFSEPDYLYLRESALPTQERIRFLLEEWLVAYPLSHHKHLLGLFQSLVTRQHWAGFFELYSHALLLSQNFKVEVEPMRGMTKKRRIDFLASRDAIPLFYVEATISIGDNIMEGSYAWLDRLCDALDDLVSPNFRLHMQATKIPSPSPNMPSTRAMRQFVKQQLANRKPDEIFAQMQIQQLSSIPLSTFDRDGWTIIVSLRPISPEQRRSSSSGTLSSISYPAGWSYDSEIVPLSTSLDEKKPSEYGDIDLPYIIAVNAVNTMTPHNINEALIKHGYFEQQPLVSAVLMANELVPRAIPRKTPILWHNPFAVYPLDQNMWLLPQLIRDPQTSQWICRDGKKGWELFQLYEEWPDEKPITLG